VLEPFGLPLSENINKEKFEYYAKSMLSITKGLELSIYKFETFYLSQFPIKKISKKLQSWHELTFADFLKELTKAMKATNKTRIKEGQEPIATLTKTDEFEWMELFEPKKKEAQELQAQINATEKEIDQMVYELYGLSEEEILIVEGS
jgi:hypothetical protein